MGNLKVYSNKDIAIGIGNSISLSSLEADSNTEENNNYFLIGLNFQGGTDKTRGIENIDQNPGIPMLMLKIDADKFLSTGKSTHKLKENQPINKSDQESSKDLSNVVSYEYSTMNNRPIHEELSYREMQVFKLIALGKTRKEIADQLFLSISTINTYRSRILEKMDMKNNSELMRYAFKHKLIE